MAKEKGVRKVTIARIIETVCEEYQIERDDLSEPGKKRVLAEARAIAAYLLQREHHLSLIELSNQFNRDLSALSRAAGAIREKLINNKKLPDRVSSLKAKL